jgi:hypothetical protein
MRVLDRHDRRWRVRRRWFPWRRRVRDVPDVPIDGGIGDDPISMVIGLVLLVLAIPALIVTILLLAELLLLLVLLPVVVLLRLVLPVPWTIELWSRPARRRVLGWHLEHEVPVRGWRASGARMRDLAGEIAAQRDPDVVPAGRSGPERPVVEEVAASADSGGDRGGEISGSEAPRSPFAQRGED